MKQFLNKYLIVIILFCLATYLIFPFLGGNFRISYGEGPNMLNPQYLNYFYAWQDKTSLGSFFTNQTLIFLFCLIWKILVFFSFIAHPSLLYVIYGGYFLSGLFLYICLDKILNFQNRLLYLPGVLLYVYNIFRISCGGSEASHLLFMSLPLFFLFYYLLLKTYEWRYVFILVILSIFSSSMGANLALFSTPYNLISIYFVYFILSGGYKRDLNKLLILNVALVILSFLSNLFWLLPQIELLKFYYQMSDSGKVIWTNLSSGTFFDHFRLLGMWAWRDGWSGGLYFPYYPLYYQPFLLITTFTITFLSLFHLIFLKEKPMIKFKIFIAFFFILSYLLVSGTKGILGLFYQFLYDNISLFKMYREPYSKFGPLLILATSFSLSISLFYLFRYVKNYLLQTLIIFLLSLFVLINAFPIFTESFKAKPTVPQVKLNISQVPDYWNDFTNFANKIKLNQWILVFQNNGYGSNSNWQYGINVVGNIAEFVTNSSVHIIRNFSMEYSAAGKVTDNIFKNNYEISNLEAYLGFLNIRYILQENDAEWRYSNGAILPPSVSNKIIQSKGFIKEVQFGKFTPEYLNKIPNPEPTKKIRDELYSELTNQPGLILYKINNKYFVPLFYSPKKIVISQKQVKDLDQVLSEEDSTMPLAIFLTRQNATPYANNYFGRLKNELIFSKERPVIEYKKISPVKYRIIVHKVKNIFPLIFSNNFHPDWKLYVNKYQVQKTTDLNALLENYTIDPDNWNDQATKQQVTRFISDGFISFIDNKPQFISKNFQNTIQNDNLVDGKFYETWFFSKPINEKYHLTANGFANTWIIDPANLCANGDCKKNSDNSYDLDLIVEFTAQKYFILAFSLCILILFFSIGLITIDLLYKKKV